MPTVNVFLECLGFQVTFFIILCVFFKERNLFFKMETECNLIGPIICLGFAMVLKN